MSSCRDVVVQGCRRVGMSSCRDGGMTLAYIYFGPVSEINFTVQLLSLSLRPRTSPFDSVSDSVFLMFNCHLLLLFLRQINIFFFFFFILRRTDGSCVYWSCNNKRCIFQCVARPCRAVTKKRSSSRTRSRSVKKTAASHSRTASSRKTRSGSKGRARSVSKSKCCVRSRSSSAKRSKSRGRTASSKKTSTKGRSVTVTGKKKTTKGRGNRYTAYLKAQLANKKLNKVLQQLLPPAVQAVRQFIYYLWYGLNVIWPTVE